MLRYVPGLAGFACLVVGVFVLFGLGWSLLVAGLLFLLADRRLS